MSVIYDFFKGIINAIPIIIGRVGTFLIGIFGLGMLLGYFMAIDHVDIAFYFPAYLAVMGIMWWKLDYGAIALVAYIIALLYYPQLGM